MIPSPGRGHAAPQVGTGDTGAHHGRAVLTRHGQQHPPAVVVRVTRRPSPARARRTSGSSAQVAVVPRLWPAAVSTATCGRCCALRSAR